MQQDRKKDQPSQPTGDRKARTDRHAVEERVHAQAAQHRIPRALRHKLAGVRLLAKVKMRVHRMFQQMHRAIPGHDQRRGQLRI